MSLTNKQKRFVQEYLVDLNATQAAIRAGYSEKGASVRGSELLSNIKVAEAIQVAQQDRSKRTTITQDRVLNELALLGFSNMQDYMRVGPDGDPYLDFGDLTRDQAAALVEVTVEDFKDGRGEGARDVRRVKFKLADKLNALVKIGHHLGMFRPLSAGEEQGKKQQRQDAAQTAGENTDWGSDLSFQSTAVN